MGVVLVFWANGGAFSTSSSAMKGWCVVEAIRRQHAGHEDPRPWPVNPCSPKLLLLCHLLLRLKGCELCLVRQPGKVEAWRTPMCTS
jgi:hypothetical protein